MTKKNAYHLYDSDKSVPAYRFSYVPFNGNTIRFHNKRMTRNRSQWYIDNTCPACGIVNSTGKLCTRVKTCKLCGMIQCDNNHATCSFCLYGLLTNFSGHRNACDYANCNEERVAKGKNGKRYICRRHFIHQFGEDAVPSELEVGENMRRFT